ncbi:hypothetical protein [Gracilimonas halophila]|uniref:Neurotransmitter-gated ion-channel ligand-binding domain-containing protein n=1 Tax=Gracilimonas halophila TaxID=1834464 RepID=A0ABW5JKL6_9BACT
MIEPFLYNKETLKFGSSLLLPEKDSLMNLNLGDSWMLTNTSSRIDSTIYDQYSDLRSGVESSTFSKIIFEVQAKRNHRYYILHLLIPTLLIALISFMIFWIQHFRAQIFIGITSLSAMIFLIVYSAPDVPKLPYNTFIEYIFIIGNLFILFGIIAAVANHRFLKNSQRKFDLLKICRRVIPLTFLLVLVAVTSFIF